MVYGTVAGSKFVSTPPEGSGAGGDVGVCTVMYNAVFVLSYAQYNKMAVQCSQNHIRPFEIMNNINEYTCDFTNYVNDAREREGEFLF